MGIRMTGVVLALLATAGTAEAQRVVQPGPGATYHSPAPVADYPPLPQPPIRPAGRWGGPDGGRERSGDAPGGWAGYHAPQRGFRLPSYWVAPRFVIDDWRAYGLQPPPPGYRWTRYYDDAVLIDGRGSVHDSVGGLDWDGYDHGGAYARREDDGIGGPAGYALASSGDSRRTGYGAEYPFPHPPRGRRDDGGHAGEPGPGYPPPPPVWVSRDGDTTVTVTTSGGPDYAPPAGYAAPIAYGYGGAVTTITVQTQPVVTTTTTEIVEDSVTYTRPVVRRVWRKPVWRPRPRPVPRCVCGS